MYHRKHVEKFLQLPNVKDRLDLGEEAKATILDRVDKVKDGTGYFSSTHIRTILDSEDLTTLFQTEWEKLSLVVVIAEEI